MVIHPQVRVVVRPYGSVVPLGVFAFGIEAIEGDMTQLAGSPARRVSESTFEGRVDDMRFLEPPAPTPDPLPGPGVPDPQPPSPGPDPTPLPPDPSPPTI